LFKLGTP